MNGTTQASLHYQRGISVTGLIFILAIVGFFGIMAAKIFPSVLEYKAIKNSIEVAKATNGTVREIQLSFDKNADINAIDAITGKDLIISKESGVTEVSFSYEKRIPLVANATLLIAYSGTTDKSGKVPAKEDNPKP
jgi:hypothetical protein